MRPNERIQQLRMDQVHICDMRGYDRGAYRSETAKANRGYGRNMLSAEALSKGDKEGHSLLLFFLPSPSLSTVPSCHTTLLSLVGPPRNLSTPSGRRSFCLPPGVSSEELAPRSSPSDVGTSWIVIVREPSPGAAVCPGWLENGAIRASMMNYLIARCCVVFNDGDGEV